MSKHRLLVLLAGLLCLTAAAFAQVGTIEGSVLLPLEGGPASGATVMLFRSNHDSLAVQTDDLGLFRFDSLAVGDWRLTAFLAPYQPVTAVVHVSTGQTVHPVLVFAPAPTGYGRLEGTVLLPNNGGPAAGARVVLFRAAGDSLVTLTDAAGLFAFDSARVGRHDIHATLDGYRIVYGHAQIPESATGHITLVLRSLLTGFGAVDGVVRLPLNGGPAMGATVMLLQSEVDTLITTTDSLGHFAFADVNLGEHVIFATLAGYERAVAEVHVVDGGTAHVTLVLRAVLTGGGTVDGLVMLADATPVARAIVRLNGQGQHCHFVTETNAEGHFGFVHVPAGNYEVTAMLPMHGFVEADVTVVENETTTLTLTLDDSAHGPNHHHGDTLTTVNLTGTAIVITENADSLNHPPRVHYLLDIDGDGLGDYRLAFGPPWYQPASGAVRPANGDSITIHGGLLTYTTPPVVVVYDINGLLWRAPFHGHGGHGGGDHGQGFCRPDSLTRVELSGVAVVRTTGGFHGEQTGYALAADDSTIIARLDFGRPDYLPESGAVRPVNGDLIAIVGGQIYCPDAQIPVVIVYEINGLLWREPGDTLALGAAMPSAVDEPVVIGAPSTYLTARNYPNPFNPTTTIQYSLPVAGAVTLRIFDIVGREVAVLVNQTQAAGSYAIAWDGHNAASGLYFYRLTVGNQTLTQRMTLLK